MDPLTGPDRSRRLPDFLLGQDGLLRPIWRAISFAGVAYLTSGLVVRVFAILSGSVPGVASIPCYATLCAVLLLETWMFLLLMDERSFRTLGLWFYAGWARETLGGIGIGLLLISAVVGPIAAAGAVRFTGWGEAGTSVWFHLVRTAIWLVLAATAEELLFRGYAFQRLIDSVGEWGAVAVLSALFALAHLQNPAATVLSTVNTALAGVVLSVAYLRTRGLWLPIGLHWAWNFTMGPVFAFPVSGLRVEPMMLRVNVAGPAWLTGGNYGPEGSVVLTVISAAAILWLALDKRIHVSSGMQEALK